MGARAGPGRVRCNRIGAGAGLHAAAVPGRHARPAGGPGAEIGHLRRPARPARASGRADVCHRTRSQLPHEPDVRGRHAGVGQMNPALDYTWAQGLADLSQIAAIAALTGFFLFAIVVDLALPKPRRGGAVATVPVTGFSYPLGTAVYRWPHARAGPAYHGFATL